jgi:hypothetical protein
LFLEGMGAERTKEVPNFMRCLYNSWQADCDIPHLVQMLRSCTYMNEPLKIFQRKFITIYCWKLKHKQQIHKYGGMMELLGNFNAILLHVTHSPTHASLFKLVIWTNMIIQLKKVFSFWNSAIY